MQEPSQSEKRVTIWLPKNRAILWGSGDDPELRDKWYVPVVYQKKPLAGFRKVEVPESCLEGGWFHPDRHENLPALAEQLS